MASAPTSLRTIFASAKGARDVINAGWTVANQPRMSRVNWLNWLSGAMRRQGGGRESEERRDALTARGMLDRGTLSLEALVLPQAFAFEALLNVLERRDLVPRAEVLEEIRRLREKAPKTR
jgi:hypothetical protein